MSFCQFLSPRSIISWSSEDVLTVYNQAATHIKAIFQSRYGMINFADKDIKRRKRAKEERCSGSGYRSSAGIHAVRLIDNKPQRARPPPNGTWPELHPGSPAIEVWARKAHLALILLVFNFASVCGEGNKQSSSSAMFPYSCLPPPAPYFPPGLKFILTHTGSTHISVYRYRSYIEVEFQSSPHRVDDRVYLKEKRQGGDFKSEEDIKKIHRRKKAPLRQE